MTHKNIVLIGQRDFRRTGRSKDQGNDRARITFICGTHSHHSDEVQLKDKVVHCDNNAGIILGNLTTMKPGFSGGQANRSRRRVEAREDLHPPEGLEHP